jgi:hypothetical protein
MKSIVSSHPLAVVAKPPSAEPRQEENAYHSRGIHSNPENMPVRRTQSHANAELVSPLRRRIGEDAVQSNPGKKESRDFEYVRFT